MTIPPVRDEGLDKVVDKVAKAIHDDRYQDYEWTMLDLSEQDDYRNIAYAAIIATLEAIREPTQDQVNAGIRNMPKVVNKSMSSRYLVQESYRAMLIYEAMIDQLIKEIEQR